MHGRPAGRAKAAPRRDLGEVPGKAATLKDLGASGPAFTPQPRKRASSGMTKISEVAEWAEESSCAITAVMETDENSDAPRHDAAPRDGSPGSALAALRRYGGGGAIKGGVGLTSTWGAPLESVSGALHKLPSGWSTTIDGGMEKQEGGQAAPEAKAEFCWLAASDEESSSSSESSGSEDEDSATSSTTASRGDVEHPSASRPAETSLAGASSLAAVASTPSSDSWNKDPVKPLSNALRGGLAQRSESLGNATAAAPTSSPVAQPPLADLLSAALRGDVVQAGSSQAAQASTASDSPSDQSVAARASGLAANTPQKEPSRRGSPATAKARGLNAVLGRAAQARRQPVGVPMVSKVAASKETFPLGKMSSSLAGLRKAYSAQSGESKATTDASRVAESSISIAEDQMSDIAAFGKEACATTAVEEDEVVLLDEWDQVAAKTEEMRVTEAANKGKISSQSDITLVPIKYGEVQQWVLQLKVDPGVLRPLTNGNAQEDRKSLASWWKSTANVSPLDKDLVLLLKGIDFDFNEIVHLRMLRTMYVKLSRSKICPTIGRHWEVLGFQNTDPRMDLNRSGGVLNTVHMFYVFAHHLRLLQDAFVLAQDDEQNFPLACVCINLTKMTTECFLDGGFASLSDVSATGLEVSCKVFAASFFQFYWQWRSQRRTIKDTELTFRSIEALLKTRPAALLEEHAAHEVGQATKTSEDGSLDFADLDKNTGSAALILAATVGLAAPGRARQYQDQEVAFS